MSLPVLLLLFFFNLNFNNVKAGPGDSCSNPYIIYMDSAFVQMPLTDSITWVKFIPTGNFADIVVADPSDTLNGRITVATLYGGCSSADSIMSLSYFPNTGDSIISLISNSLTIGNTYLVKLIKPIRGIHDASRYFYIGAFSNPFPPFNMAWPLEYRNTPHNFTSNCDTGSHVCDIVSNGNFEVTNLSCSQMLATTSPGLIMQYDWRATNGNSDVSCWWSNCINAQYFNSCYPLMSCGRGCCVPRNMGGCNVQDHSITYGWSGPTYGYCNIVVDYLYQESLNSPNDLLPGWYAREYLLQQLSNPMVAGATYNVSFWVRVDSFSGGEISAGDMGMFLSPHEPYGINNSWDYAQLDSGTGHVAVAQITGTPTALCPTCGCSPAFNTANTWVNITGKYTATGNEKFIEIGNFRKDSAHRTITITPSDECAYFVDDVSITPYLTASASPSILCGVLPSSTLTASNGFTNYTWSNGATGQTITVSPSSSTTYTVTASYGVSCPTYTATVTVTVDPPLSVIVAATGVECIGIPVTALPSGGTSPYTYSWSPGGNTTATLPSPSSGTYTVSLTDALGCSASTVTSFTINPDCCYLSASCSNPLTIPSGRSSSSYTSADFTNNPCISISGPGTFTIPSGTFTITNCDIAMGANATIDVASGATLVIDTSRLYACGDMWQGIKVEPGGTLRISGTSTTPCIVEDAVQAVQVEGSAYITYGLLNNNLYDIYISGGNPSLVLHSSTLTCESDLGYSNNAYLKAPHLGAITNSGVYISSLTFPDAIQVGDYTSASYRNTFSNMNYGVNANEAGFIVYNNLFENLSGPGSLCMVSVFGILIHCPPIIGIAVLANDTIHDEYSGGHWENYASIVEKNTIENCYRGVDITGYSYPVIVHNHIYNAADAWSIPHANPYPYGDHGIYLKDVESPQVSYDTISNFMTGIHLNGFALAGPDDAAYLEVAVTNNEVGTSGTYGIMNSGIIAENAIEAGSAYLDSTLVYYPVRINNNGVSAAASSCITLSHVVSQIDVMVHIDTNALAILPSTSRTNGAQKSGVYVAGSYGFSDYNNTISASGTYVSSSPTGRADTSVIGIRSVLSQGIHECNSLIDLGECMMFEGPNYPSSVYYNYMANAYNGFVLESSGEIGTQGNATTPIGDQWQGPFSNYYTYTLNSYASSSPLFVINNSIQNPGYSAVNNATYNIGTGDYYYYTYNVYPATGTEPSCPSHCSKCRAPVPAQYRPFAEKIVEDSVPYSVFIDESEYIGEQNVFQQISEDTSLMDSSTILHSFYNYTTSTADTNNIGRLYTVGLDINIGNFAAAQTLNSSITPINTIEQNQQLVNSVYLSTLGSRVDTLNTSQYDTLVSVATQCPVEGGDAVFEARGLLNRLLNTSYIISDSCLNDSASGHAPHKRPARIALGINIQAKVYPNPANTLLNVEVSLQAGQIAYFELYNNLGQLIMDKTLNSQLTSLPVTDLSSGIYYYRIIGQDGSTLKADKQMLMH